MFFVNRIFSKVVFSTKHSRTFHVARIRWVASVMVSSPCQICGFLLGLFGGLGMRDILILLYNINVLEYRNGSKLVRGSNVTLFFVGNYIKLI